MLPGVALKVNVGVVPVTVTETVVVFVMLPDVPVTVILYVPAVTDEPTVMDILDVPAPVIDVGLKATVTPVGWPVAESPITPSNPPTAVLVIVEPPEPPCAIVTEFGDAESVNPGAGGPVSELISPDPFGLPQPVARS